MNGNSCAALLTAEQLAAALQVNKATVYEWGKAKTIPCLPSRAVCAVQFARSFGEPKKEKHG